MDSGVGAGPKSAIAGGRPAELVPLDGETETAARVASGIAELDRQSDRLIKSAVREQAGASHALAVLIDLVTGQYDVQIEILDLDTLQDMCE